MSIQGDYMYKNKSHVGLNNLCGNRIKHFRENLPVKTSQRAFADLLQLEGLDLDKNAIQRIECGKRFITDIELKVIAKVLNVTYQELLD